MNKFTERKKALLKKANPNQESIDNALTIITEALEAINDDESFNLILIQEDVIEDSRAALRIYRGGEQEFAVWYAEDSIGLDFDPEDEDSDPIEISKSEAHEILEKLDELVAKAKSRDAERASEEDEEEKPDAAAAFISMLESVVKHLSGENSETDDESIVKVLTKIVNTIKDLEGPKYKDLHACWHKGVLMVTSGDERILVICKSPVVGWRVTTTPNKGPASLVHVSDKTEKLVIKVWDLVRENLKNGFEGQEEGLDKISDLFEALPKGMQHCILGSILKDLSKQ